MINIFSAFFYIILRTCFSAYIKKNKTDRYSLTLITSSTAFIFFLSYFYVKNNYNFNIKRITEVLYNKYTLIEGITGQMYFFFFITALPLLPFNLATPLSALWLFIALFLEPFILDNYSLEAKVIAIFILFIIGLLTINYHHFNKGFNLKKYPNYKLGLLFLLLSCLGRGLQVTFTKKIGDDYETHELALMSFTANLIIALLMFGYKYLFSDYTPNIHNLVYLIISCILLNNISIFLRFYSIKHLSENLFILITQTSIILSILIGYLFFKEKIVVNQIIGFIIIILSIYLLTKYEYQ